VRLLRSPERVVVAIAVVLGCVLRWWYLGTPSLWWDELVQIGTAEAETAWEVLDHVRRGIPSGAGNAGAVPLDYLAMHFWLQVVPLPARPEALEAYYRFPSFLFSCATLVALAWYARRFFGDRVAALATLLLALSLPHVLYAAEARFYSLLLLMGIVQLATFTALVAHPGGTGRWLAFTCASLAYALTGLFSLLLIFWQYLVLLALRLGRAERGGALRALGISAVAVSGLLALYYADTSLSAQSIRGTSHLTGTLVARQTLEFFAMNDPWLGLALLAALLVAPAGMRLRRHALWPVAAAVAAGIAATPFAIAALMSWKHHFYHPRHGLLLLPGVLLLLAIALAMLADLLERMPLPAWWRRTVPLAAAMALAVAWQGPPVTRYLANPNPFFQRTKILRDFKSLARDLRTRVAEYDEYQRYLLIVGRVGPGHLSNPLLGKYLEWYGLTDRVILRGVPRPSTVLRKIRSYCPTSCEQYGWTMQVVLDLQPPFELSGRKRLLVGLPRRIGRWTGRPRDTTVLLYTPIRRERRDGSLRGWRPQPYTGFVVFTSADAT
jgi:hypothetical protein